MMNPGWSDNIGDKSGWLLVEEYSQCTNNTAILWGLKAHSIEKKNQNSCILGQFVGLFLAKNKEERKFSGGTYE